MFFMKKKKTLLGLKTIKTFYVQYRVPRDYSIFIRQPQGGGEYFYIIFVQYDMLTKLVIHTTASS